MKTNDCWVGYHLMALHFEMSSCRLYEIPINEVFAWLVYGAVLEMCSFSNQYCQNANAAGRESNVWNSQQSGLMKQCELEWRSNDIDILRERAEAVRKSQLLILFKPAPSLTKFDIIEMREDKRALWLSRRNGLPLPAKQISGIYIWRYRALNDISEMSSPRRLVRY